MEPKNNPKREDILNFLYDLNMHGPLKKKEVVERYGQNLFTFMKKLSEGEYPVRYVRDLQKFEVWYSKGMWEEINELERRQSDEKIRKIQKSQVKTNWIIAMAVTIQSLMVYISFITKNAGPEDYILWILAGVIFLVVSVLVGSIFGFFITKD